MWNTRLPASNSHARNPECIDTGHHHSRGYRYEQRSYYHLERAGGNFIRHCVEQHAIERHGERPGNLRLYTSGRNGAESREADAFHNVHADRHKDLFGGYCFCATHR